MAIQRCPECGIRLKTNYCDVCMKRVPFKGMPAKQTFQHYEGSSAHRTEKGHECVSFDQKDKKTFSFPTRRTASGNKKAATVMAIIVAILGLLPTIFGIFEDMAGAEPVPEPMPTAPVNSSIAAIEPGEIYNDGAIIVTADFADLYYDDYTVFMTIVNQSPSDIIVGTDLLSVNGYMHSGSLYAEVDAGEMVQESLQLYSWELEQAGIEAVAEIAFHLNIYDQQDYADIARSELITIETEIADTYVQPEFLDGWELYRDQDLAVRLVSTAIYSSDCELRLYLENLSGQTLGVSVPESAINGKPVEGSFWSILRPDTKLLTSVYLYDSEDVSLDQIQEISMNLNLEYMEDGFVDSTRITNITFNPNTL